VSRGSAGYPGSSSRSRPRTSRSASYDNTPPHAASPPHGEDDRRSSLRKRNTLKKAPRRDSLHNDQYYEEQDSPGFAPRLGQIREGKESRHSRSQASSSVGSSAEPRPRTRRRRTTDDHAVKREQSQYKHHALQRHADSPVRMAEPDVAPAPSKVTLNSNESNLTITQPEYEEHSDIDDDDDGEEEDDDDSNSDVQTYISEGPGEDGQTPSGMEAPQSNVFQYMTQAPTVEEYSDEEERHGQPLSSAASSSGSSSGGSQREGTQSSHTGSSQFVRDTPTTSPASTRMSKTNSGSSQQPRKTSTTRKPLYASSFVHGPNDHDEEPGESEEVSEESDESDGHRNINIDNGPPQQQHYALERTLPPRVPSTSSRHSDPHAKRLRRQEQELASHVLKSPQPQNPKDFQFTGGPSPHPQPSMPMYSPQTYSDAPPASFEAPTAYQAEWPQFPPPLSIAYPSQPGLESPSVRQPLPLTVQSPMGVPSVPAQYAPPVHQYPGAPPQYQTHVTAPDVTRTTAAGYELLANKLSETPKKSSSLRKPGSVVPMYRKFEHLNHRVLLHLQDEVCELEEELRYLDESIIQMSPRDDAGHAFPASRRGDARFGSELHYKRTELLGRIFQKLGQYSKSQDPALKARHNTPDVSINAT
jgi:hypothetical protein